MDTIPFDAPRPALGEPAPWFTTRSGDIAQFHLSSLGGRHVVLCFPGTATSPALAAIDLMADKAGVMSEDHAVCFAVAPESAIPVLRSRHPRLRLFHDDAQGGLARLYGVGPAGGWVVIDVSMRILMRAGLTDGAALLDRVAALPPAGLLGAADILAPVLTVPGVFEPEFCRRLIDLYRQQGGIDSGFMREQDGRTVGIVDHGFKRRRDLDIADETLKLAARQRIERRLIPMIARALQFRTTRMERYIVACYDAAENGFFRPHRDNTTRGTAHRRFAVTINLNADEFEGGELRFPEFGPRTYRAPTGGAVVFSCSLLHEAMPVTRGTRYAFLPFLYDEEGAKLREANVRYLGDGTAQYQATAAP